MSKPDTHETFDHVAAASLRQTCCRDAVGPRVVAVINVAAVGDGGEVQDDVHARDERLPVHFILEIG
ncbi:MAG: hypothetical protein QOJ84_3892 [Bradyrhizobium sp.]|nr:hypothetical protein [Bradyrhizobium sp.]